MCLLLDLLSAQTILLRELNRGYVASNVASATIFAQPFDEQFVNSAERSYSVELTIENFLRYHQYEVSLALERPYRTIQLTNLIEDVPGVTAVEARITTNMRRVYADDGIGGTIPLTAAPSDSSPMAPELEAGRWLTLQDTNAIVVNTDLMEDEPDLSLRGRNFAQY